MSRVVRDLLLTGLPAGQSVSITMQGTPESCDCAFPCMQVIVSGFVRKGAGCRMRLFDVYEHCDVDTVLDVVHDWSDDIRSRLPVPYVLDDRQQSLW